MAKSDHGERVMAAWLGFGVFLCVWMGFMIWGLRKKWSVVASFGGGFIVALLSLFPMFFIANKLEGTAPTAISPAAANSADSLGGGLPAIEYSDDTAYYVEISNCVVRGVPGAQLVDCNFKNKTP